MTGPDADAKRLDWLGNNAPFDAWHGLDIHELAAHHAGEQYADEEAVKRAYAKAIRTIIDAAMRSGDK